MWPFGCHGDDHNSQHLGWVSVACIDLPYCFDVPMNSDTWFAASVEKRPNCRIERTLHLSGGSPSLSLWVITWLRTKVLFVSLSQVTLCSLRLDFLAKNLSHKGLALPPHGPLRGICGSSIQWKGTGIAYLD